MQCGSELEIPGAASDDGSGMLSQENGLYHRVFAIVPAAGRSRRMGTAKSLLQVGGKPMLVAVVDSLLASRAAGLIIVTRRGILERLPPMDPRVGIAFNEDDSTDMIDSVRIGMGEWRSREVVGPRDGYLVCPGDHPGISAVDFDACIGSFMGRPECIVVASREGRRGHPIIFPASDAWFVESSACDGGLKRLPAAYPNRIRLVDCSSPGIMQDIDTPGDLL